MEKFSLHKNNNMQSHLTIISLSDTVSSRYLKILVDSQMTGFLSSCQKGSCLSAYQDGRTQLNLKNCIKTKDFYWRCCRSMASSHSSPSLSSLHILVCGFPLFPLAVAHQIFFLSLFFPHIRLSTCFRLLSTTVLYIWFRNVWYSNHSIHTLEY